MLEQAQMSVSESKKDVKALKEPELAQMNLNDF